MKADDVSQEAETPGMASLKLAIRWAIQEVDDLFAMNMDEMEENEMVARIAHAVLPAIVAAKVEEREKIACALESGEYNRQAGDPMVNMKIIKAIRDLE